MYSYIEAYYYSYQDTLLQLSLLVAIQETLLLILLLFLSLPVKLFGDHLFRVEVEAAAAVPSAIIIFTTQIVTTTSSTAHFVRALLFTVACHQAVVLPAGKSCQDCTVSQAPCTSDSLPKDSRLKPI